MNKTEKTSTVEKATANNAKKERKSRKGMTRTFAAEATTTVNPVIETINTLINDSTTSVEALKMLRLELRKAVRRTRATLRARSNAN